MTEKHTPGGWFVVGADGYHYPCQDEHDAHATAYLRDELWPPDRPHRAVQLVDAAALRALKKLAQAIAWRDFGECRGFDTEEPLNVTSALYLARTVIDRIEGDKT